MADVPPQTVFAVPSALGGHRPSSPFPCIGGSWVAARPASRCGDGRAAILPFSPCADGLSFPCIDGVWGYCPSPFPCTDRRKGRLPLFSSQRWDRGAAPLLLAAVGQRGRFASPRGGGAERPFCLSSRRWDREAVPPLLAAVGQRGRSASPRGGGTEGPLRFSSRRWSRVSSPLSPIELFPLFSPFVMVRRGCGPPLLLTSEGRALSLPPHAGQGLHPHSATPVGSGRALPTPSLCGGTGAVLSPLSPAAVGADPTDRMKREVPLQSASTERWRPKAVGRQKEAVDGQGCPALSRSPFPLRPQGRGACCGRGPPLPSSRAPVRRPSAQSPFPALCKRPARVTHRLPFSRPLPPLSRRVPCPHRVPAGKEKRAPGPHRGGAELF